MAGGYESHIDRQIREAQERGEFDNLPGAGKPLPGAGEHYDEDWWLKQWVRREQISGALPGSLMLLRDVEEFAQALSTKRSEQEVRRVAGDLNARIIKAQRGLLDGPAIIVKLIDVEEVVSRWRRIRSGR